MKHLISIADLTKDEIVGLMDEADRFKEVIRCLLYTSPSPRD